MNAKQKYHFDENAERLQTCIFINYFFKKSMLISVTGEIDTTHNCPGLVRLSKSSITNPTIQPNSRAHTRSQVTLVRTGGITPSYHPLIEENVGIWGEKP